METATVESVEDYLRRLAIDKEPKVSSPTPKMAFVTLVSPLGLKYMVSRISVLVKFEGKAEHRQPRDSHVTVTSPASSPIADTTKHNTKMAGTTTEAPSALPTSTTVTGITTTATTGAVASKVARRHPISADTALGRLNLTAGAADATDVEDAITHIKPKFNNLMNRAGKLFRYERGGMHVVFIWCICVVLASFLLYQFSSMLLCRYTFVSACENGCVAPFFACVELD